MTPNRLAGILLVAALAVTACGNAEPDEDAGAATGGAATTDVATASPTPSATSKSPKPAPPPANSVLPDVTVVDVATGGKVDLAGLVPSETAVLLWAWAPHCPACAAEAPGVEAFAKANGETVSVVGLGTQDSLGLAESFVATHGVKTPQMLWDAGFESWRALRITGQPTWILLSGDGEEIARWQGPLPEDDVLGKLG